MSINFSPNFFRDSLSLPDSNYNLTEAKIISDIPTSNELSGIEVRLSKVLILDNKQPYIPWVIRYSDLYLLLVVVDDLGGEPQTITIKGFADVDDNEELPVERTAYYWKKKEDSSKTPGQIHLVASIIKSNEGIRNTGSALQDLQKSNDYKSIIQEVVKAAVSGGASAVSDSLIALTGVLGSILGKVDDTPLITTVMSFTDINGEFDQLGRHVISKKNRFAQIDVSLIVRDKNREK